MGSLRKLPFSHEKLPESIRSAVLDVEARDADWDYGDLVDMITAYLDEGGQRSPDLLIALAWYRFEFAECVMVDDILEAGRATLALLDEAGVVSQQASRLRRNAEKAVRREERQMARAAKLAGIPDERLTLRQMKDLAYWLSDQPAAEHTTRAARLWLMLHEREPESEVYHGTTFYNFARAAICLAKSGRYEEAAPLLSQAVKWPDALAAANYNNFVCYAYEQMLLRARDQGDVEGFRRVWNEAVDRLRELGGRFPTVYPLQTSMLAAALQMRLDDISAYLVRLILEVRDPVKLDSKTRMLLKSAEHRTDRAHSPPGP